MARYLVKTLSEKLHVNEANNPRCYEGRYAR